MIFHKMKRDGQPKQLQITGERHGVYFDYLIENMSSRSFYVVSQNGTAREIVPMYQSSGYDNNIQRLSSIRYTFTEGKGGRLSGDLTNSSAITNVVRYSETINTHEIAAEPYYLEDIGVVLCTHEQLPVVKHPFGRPSYNDILENLVCSLKEQTDQLSLHFIANDSTGKCNNLFLFFMGVVTSIKVTNIPAPNNTFTMVLSKDGKMVTQCSFTFEEINQLGGILRTDKGIALYVAQTQWELERIIQNASSQNIEIFSTSEETMSLVQQLREEIAKLKLENKNLNEQIKGNQNDFDVKLSSKDRMLEDLKGENHKLKLDCTGFERLISQYKGVYDYRENMAKHNASIETNEGRIKQSKMKTTQEGFKLSETIVKVGVPLLLMIGTWAVTKYTNK